MFISFEGIDGAGKTGVVQAVAYHLHRHHKMAPAVVSELSSSTGTSVKALMMSCDDPLQQLLAVEYARLSAQRLIAAPAKAAGAALLFDRYLHTTLAYQGTMQGLDAATVRARHAALGFPLPDLVIYLKLTAEQAAKRCADAGKGDKFDRLPITRVQQIIEGFDRECAADGAVIIDAALSLDEVTVQAINAVEKALVSLR